jgi:diamine N-acetyltransferase
MKKTNSDFIFFFNRKKAGYAICFYTFSTWEGRGMLLEDIFVRPEYRNLNVGKSLFAEVCKFGITMNCKRLDFHVLDWNPAQTFYQKLGATNLTEAEGWQYYRCDVKTMSELASTRK